MRTDGVIAVGVSGSEDSVVRFEVVVRSGAERVAVVSVCGALRVERAALIEATVAFMSLDIIVSIWVYVDL